MNVREERQPRTNNQAACLQLLSHQTEKVSMQMHQLAAELHLGTIASPSWEAASGLSAAIRTDALQTFMILEP